MDGKNPNPDPYKAELWVQNDAGEWIKIGNVEPLKPLFPNPATGFSSLVSIEYGLTPEELKPIVPKLNAPEQVNVELTLKNFVPSKALAELQKFAAEQIADAQAELVKKVEDGMVSAILYGNPNAKEPLGILNAPIGAKWTDPPLKVEELFNLIPPAHMSCKCVPSLEEPPPASARDLADAFVARNQHPIECPPPLELVGLLCANVGHTGANLRGYM